MSGTKGRDSGKELRKFEEDYKADGAKIETFLKTFKGDGDEPQHAEDQVAEQHLYIERDSHRFTSNLYPIPQTVESCQAG